MTLLVHGVIPFILCVGIGIAAGVGYRIWYVHQLTSQPFQAQPITFSLEPPGQAQILNLTELSGNVTKRSRTGDIIPLVAGSVLMQGEAVVADATSSAKITIPTIGAVDIGHDARVAAVDLIPEELMLSQEKGDVTYVAATLNSPITVRSLHALVKITNGSVILSVDPTLNRIHFASVSGGITLAYQDKNHTTFVVDAPTDPKYYYDDTKRAVIKPSMPKAIKRKR